MLSCIKNYITFKKHSTCSDIAFIQNHESLYSFEQHDFMNAELCKRMFKLLHLSFSMSLHTFSRGDDTTLHEQIHTVPILEFVRKF